MGIIGKLNYSKMSSKRPHQTGSKICPNKRLYLQTEMKMAQS